MIAMRMRSPLALPPVLLLFVRDLSDWHADTWPARATLRLLCIVLVFAVYPVRQPLLDLYETTLRPPIARFSVLPDLSAVAKDGRVPFRRATRYLSDEPQAGPGMVPRRAFLETASEIRSIIGTKRRYVDMVTAGGYTGLWYFLLDLTPGPFLFERDTMVINTELAAEAAVHFKRHVHEFEAVITPHSGSAEEEAFLEANPTAERIRIPIAGSQVYVLVGGGRDSVAGRQK